METKHAPAGPIDLANRVDWREVFGRAAPIEVEIGSGSGGFALGHAAAHPEIDLVAIEIRKKQAALTKEKAANQGLGNLLVLNADAKVILPRLFAPASIAAFHIQFPDPWWKARHHERRLVEDHFSILLYNLLRLDGRLEVRTDVKERGEEMALALESVGFVNHHGPGGLAPFDPKAIPSSREKGYLASGQPIYRYDFRRVAAPPRRPEAPLPPTLVGPAQRRR